MHPYVQGQGPTQPTSGDTLPQAQRKSPLYSKRIYLGYKYSSSPH